LLFESSPSASGSEITMAERCERKARATVISAASKKTRDVNADRKTAKSNDIG